MTRSLDSIPEGTQSIGRVRSEGGTLNHASVVRLVENPTLRSRKRLNPDGSEASIQGVLPGYGLFVQYPVDSPLLIFNRSQDHEERQKEGGGGRQNGGQRVDG